MNVLVFYLLLFHISRRTCSRPLQKHFSISYDHYTTVCNLTLVISIVIRTLARNTSHSILQ
jgi:hypothetical protein